MTRLNFQIERNKNFVAKGGPSSTIGTDAVTLGAGVHWEKTYGWAESNNVTIIGGACPTVGQLEFVIAFVITMSELLSGAAGGWLQGGGHSALSNTYGLGVDRVLQFKVILTH